MGHQYTYHIEATNSEIDDGWFSNGGIPFAVEGNAIKMAEDLEFYHGSARHYRVVDQYGEVVWDCYFNPDPVPAETFVCHQDPQTMYEEGN